jgi:small subunit ribosomal protein S1
LVVGSFGGMLRVAVDDDFASLMRASLQTKGDRATRRLTAGEVVEAKVIQIGADTVFVDVGTTGDGRIDRAEFEAAGDAVRLELGARIRATVLSPNLSAPLLTLALGRGMSLDLTALRAAQLSGAPVVGRVDKAIKAGLEVDLNGLRAFCPASQIELGYASDLTAFEGQTLEFKVVEIRDGGRSVVVSRRSLLEERRREQQRDLVEQLTVGAEVQGVVHAIQRHGVVVDLGGIEGFVHISEIAHHHVERIEDELSVGDSVRASVLSIEETGRGVRVRLSLKALAQRSAGPPPPAPDELLTGTVSRVASFGVFVQTPKGEGLVPIRELDLPPGSDHRRAFPVGKEVRVVLLTSDPASGKLRFSVSAVAQVEERRNLEEYAADSMTVAGARTLGSLGDVLRKQLGLPEPPRPVPQPAAAPTPAAPESRPGAGSSDPGAPARSTPLQPSGGQRRPQQMPADRTEPERSGLPQSGSHPAARRSRHRPSQPRRPVPDGVVRRRRKD